MSAQLEIDIEAAVRARDTGMATAIDHAETDAPGWTETAIAFLTRYAEKHAEFCGYMVVGAAELDPEFPTAHPKAFGMVFRKALRLGLIEKTGRFMPHPQRHACPAVIWASKVYQGRTS